MITSEEIESRLWAGANELRGSMDASNYKDYMLGLMFYKFLSDKTLETYKKNADLDSSANVFEEYKKAHEKYGEELDNFIQKLLGYHVEPKYLYQTWEEDINNGDFELQEVTDSLNAFERSVSSTKDKDDFKGLFSIDLTDSGLGNDLKARSSNIQKLINLFADLNMADLQKKDILGDAYEYLIAQFASNSGKKAGEFYTPAQVSEVIAQIIARTTNIKSIYDPTVGSGSLLLTVGKYLLPDQRKNLHYYGQEENDKTYNLTRMNLLLHGVRPENMTINRGDTLKADWPEDPSHPGEGFQFDAVVMNPPYSIGWNKDDDYQVKVSDPRFSEFGVLPPNSKADFAFLLHGLYHLGQQGTMGVVLPHGVLFRGGTEGIIRQKLIEKNYIDAIIGLPSNLFTNTGIPVAIWIMKKNRQLDDPILVVDASDGFIKDGKKNILRERDIAKIVDTYINREETPGYSHLASRQEIIDNDYNLNIPRYVEPIDQSIAEDVDAHLMGGIPEKNIKQLKAVNSITGDVIENSLEHIRPGYVKLTVSVDELKQKVIQDERVQSKTEHIKGDAENYIDEYYSRLKKINSDTNLSSLKDEMFDDIKNILLKFDNVDQYEGFQIVADLWEKYLQSDTEIIAGSGFYEAGRTRVPNMVTKGSGKKKYQKQEGWIGEIIPNELIADTLYSDQQSEINDLSEKCSDIENQLSDLLESAKSEDTEENDALFDVIKRNKDDELQDSFDSKKVKSALKEADKGTQEYDLLHKVDTLMTNKSKANRSIKQKEKDLQEAIYERIIHLTDEEIDQLVFKKWFDGFVDKVSDLAIKPLNDDLNTLQKLNDRYSDTLSDIDKEIDQAESEFEDLLKDLVVK